ncbi:uncharacterized protein [Euwallacea fornicatus]|uniref:uncharacterized protein n=1 Tax=Euwallacea fornicatus TaxID=995702 RepID=UPI00338FD144
MASEIPKLEDLLGSHLQGEILSQNVSRLTAPGENYGSLMLNVDIKVRNHDGKEEIIHAVAKCVPPNKKMQEVFNTPLTFINEIGWYQEAIPALKAFEREQGAKVADYYTEIFGARTSLDDNKKEVDDGGVLLLENLMHKGFKNANRILGFNEFQTKIAIQGLASFHASTLALKLLKPKEFENKVKKFVRIETILDPEFSLELFEPAFKIMENDPESAKAVPKIRALVQYLKSEASADQTSQCREPWATVLHTDFWVNNIMLKEENNVPSKVIILDLQTCGFGSSVQDLLFLLGTSVQTNVAKELFDCFIDFYYKELIANLKNLKVSTKQFSYESFQKELKLEALPQLFHIMFFIPIVLAHKDNVKDVTDEDFDPRNDLFRIFQNITQEQKEKYVYIAKIFLNHNWL